MKIIEVATTAFTDQRPGTSGLRKKTVAAMTPHYIENFIQSTFDALETPLVGKAIVIGGDGRFFNDVAIQSIWKIAVANGISKVMIAKNGLASTPAVSAIIRKHKADGGFILSASHNPGGLNYDFGIKYNGNNGGPAPEELTEKIFSYSKAITHYKTIEHDDIALDQFATYEIGDSRIEVIDAIKDYALLMQELFDFAQLKKLFKSGLGFRFDAMHAATGPYAHYIFEELLEAPRGTVMRGNPLPDFGGAHPDPNLIHAHDVIHCVNTDPSISFAAASDGDGDRNLILGKNCFVSPGDSLAVIAAHAVRCIPGYKSGIRGIARSMPTSQAPDHVAAAMKIPCFETPTGWKFFGSLMDADLCTLCGEESFGTGSNHVREKDGLWAVLAWLSIIAATGKQVEELLFDHWNTYGRAYFQRHDFEDLDSAAANKLYSELRDKLPSLVGEKTSIGSIAAADDFSYTDPITGARSENQGLRIVFKEGHRIVIRLSGTGTSGATVRVYLERFSKDNFKVNINEALQPLKEFAYGLLEFKERFNVEEPDVIT